MTNADFLNFSPDRFFPITHESRLQLNDDIASGKDTQLPLDISSVKPIAFVIGQYVDGIAFELNCKIGINCAARFAVNDNGVNMIIWEMIIKGPDGKNMRVAFTTAPVPGLDQSPFTEYAQQVIHRLGEKLTEVNLVLPLQDDTQKHSPMVDELLNPTTIRMKLREGIIDENTADDAIWLTNVSGY